MTLLEGQHTRQVFSYSRWTSSLPSCLWLLRIFPSLPGSRLTIFYRDASSALLQLTRPPMVEFYLLTFPRFPFRKKERKSYFGKNRTHDFRTSRCAGYLLDHSGDDLACYSDSEILAARQTMTVETAVRTQRHLLDADMFPTFSVGWTWQGFWPLLV